MSSATNGDIQPPVVFDSLPYYDNELEQYPILKEKVERELAREGKPQQTLHPRVPPAPTLFANDPMLQAELERVSNHQPLPPLDTSRYQLPAPSTPENEEEWLEALKNARAQLEHQHLRQTNLSLLHQYGPNAWRIHNYLNEASAKNVEKALEDLKNLTVEVNRERKNFQIEMANVALEVEIDRLNKREVELAAAL
ncbi:hypothetical protein BN946_scf184942.g80 [Trametes cinnabarina]|uniref:Breast carcinoma amplified sequence 2 n=1 Tax=Pycnoporus cinnabarinus TaxID=5643 RepID=A0A060S7F2_PYCCI|nr:hypothetical protein BN946_scf184942.g80 [Trametes cinnabarina]